jgi:hypothetical protein
VGGWGRGPRGSGYARIPGDHYATPAWVVDALLSVETFDGPVLECAPGDGHMIRSLEAGGVAVVRGDQDFFSCDPLPGFAKNICTNPPFKLAEKFCRHAIEMTRPYGGKVAMLLPHVFDTAQTRRDLFGSPFKAKFVLTRRIRWANLEQKKNGPSTNHAWYIWDHGHSGLPFMGWL